MTCSSRLPWALSALLVSGLIGCQAETFGADEIQVDPDALHIVDGAAIAGAGVTFTAPWMASLLDTASISVGDRPATLAVRADSGRDRFQYLIPADLPAGSYDVWYHPHVRDSVIAGHLQLGGFSGLRELDASLVSPAQPIEHVPGLYVQWSRSTAPGCVASVLNARAATLEMGVRMPFCGYGLGGTYRTDQALAYTVWSGGYWIRFGVGPTSTRVDSLRAYGTNWPTQELAPGLYLHDWKQETQFTDTASGAPPSFLPYGSNHHPDYVAYSSDGHWAVTSNQSSTLGAFIVDRIARSYLWSSGWLLDTRPLFLADDQLVIYGWRRGSSADTIPGTPAYEEVLAHVDPGTGDLLDSAKFAEAGSAFDNPIALETNGWLVFPSFANGRAALSIRDPDTFAEIAHPSSTLSTSPCRFYTTYAVEDVALRKVYVITVDCSPTRIWTFDLPQ